MSDQELMRDVQADDSRAFGTLYDRHAGLAWAEVIALAYYGELSHTEIATRLSLPQGTVKGRMRLGLQKLREPLDVT